MAAASPTARIATEGLTRAEVIVLIVHAFRALGWGIEHLHPMRVAGSTNSTRVRRGDAITIDLDGPDLSVTSKARGWALFAGTTRQQRNVDAFMAAFAHARATVTPDAMTTELLELERSGIMQQDASTARANEFHVKDIGSVLIPREGFFATPLLIDASVLVYILMVVSGVHFFLPSSEDLLKWGANFRPITLGGEWWRLLTCCFEHIGIVHLLFNMYALLMVGLYIEPILGRWRVLVLYAVTGIAASIASLWWHAETISAGASGAIFGLYGAFLALLFTDLIHKDVRRSLLSSIGIFVGYNLLNGMKGGVDNAAHIGGLLSGLVLGFALYPALRAPQRKNLQWSTLTGASVVVLGIGAALIAPLPADDHRFQERMERFGAYEEEGLRALNMPEGTEASAQLVEVEQHSLPGWTHALQLLDSTNTLQLSPAIAERRAQLRAYVQERITNMELLKRALVDPADTEARSTLDRSFARADSLFKAATGQ